MPDQIKQAARLRKVLRTIPGQAYFTVTDCRLLHNSEPRSTLRPEGDWILFFGGPRDNREVTLMTGPAPLPARGDPQSQEEETLVFFRLHSKEPPLPEFSGILRDRRGPMDWYEGYFTFLYHEHLDSLGDFRRGICGSLVHLILSQMVLSSGEISRPSYSRSSLMEVCQYIKNHPEKRFTLPELAWIAGLSPRHFSRVFTRELGMTPKEYELRQRMAYARYLIRNRGMNVQETAIRCGYSDPFLFSRQYKKILAITPSRDCEPLP